MTTHYQRWAYLSPLHGGMVTRISVQDPRGPAEFFAVVSGASGPQYRAARDEALDMIEQAIEAGMAPGEVRWGKAAEA